MPRREVLIVNGYGCTLTPDLKRYLDTVLAYARSNRERIAYIICSGGFTDPELPKISEADLMADYLQARGVKIPVMREKNSYSTYDNLMHARKIIRDGTTPSMARNDMILPYVEKKEVAVTIFCRAMVQRKVAFLAPRILTKLRARPIIFGVPTKEPVRSLLVHGIMNYVDILGWYVPPLRRYKQRLQRKGIAHKIGV